MPRSTHVQLLTMKQELFKNCYRKKMKWKDAATILKLHPKSLSRLKKRYEALGDCALIGRKPGPKHFTPENRTPLEVERVVEDLAEKHLQLGPLPLSEKLFELRGIRLDQSTIYRILKRRKVRYTTAYKRWKQEPKLYCLDEPGIEIQLDGCYPHGRSRKIVCYDSIDDCSRFVFGKCYAGVESDELAVQYVSELVEKVPFRIQRIRVDNRYGKAFERHCNTLGIQVIRNDAYSPEQNGKIERFHRTSKQEFFRKLPWNVDLTTLNYHFGLWLHEYNYHRKHGGFGMDRLTPVQKLISVWIQSLNYINPKKVTGTLQQYII